jgi:hypothetical protein
MAGEKSYVVEMVSGHNITRRGLAFIICDNDQDIDAKVVFNGLDQKIQRTLHTRFDHWLDGGTNDYWFHGWPNDAKHKDCFVFKWREKSQNHRLYGFLYHPLSLDQGFQLCILVSHAKKNTWETDPRELDGANELKDEPAVKKAIAETAKLIKPQPPR